MNKSTRKSLEGKVGTATARSISGRSGFESGTEGTRPEKSRMYGNTLFHEHSRQSDASVRELTAWEKRGGQVDPRIRKGSPTLGAKK